VTTQKIYQMKMMDVNEENDGITIVLHFNFRCEFNMGPALCEEDILRGELTCPRSMYHL